MAFSVVRDCLWKLIYKSIFQKIFPYAVWGTQLERYSLILLKYTYYNLSDNPNCFVNTLCTYTYAFKLTVVSLLNYKQFLLFWFQCHFKF